MAKIDLIQALRTLSNTQKQYVDNLVKIEVVEQTVSDSLTLNLNNKMYQYVEEMKNGTTINLPTVNGFAEIHLIFNAEDDLALILPNALYQKVPEIIGGVTYEFIFTHIADMWLCGYIEYGGDGYDDSSKLYKSDFANALYDATVWQVFGDSISTTYRISEAQIWHNVITADADFAHITKYNSAASGSEVSHFFFHWMI